MKESLQERILIDGIQTGEPIAAAQRKWPGLVVVPLDYGLYVTKMAGMDGLELTRKIKEKDADVLSEEKFLSELSKIAEKLEGRI